MQAFKTGKVTHLLLLTLITGCAEWNSVPTVVDQNYGRAYTNMVKNQTLCPEHGQMAKDPKLCPEHGPVIAMDGQKAQGNINAYRAAPKEGLEESKTGAQYTGGTGAATTDSN
jgi:hypothetical protein